MPKPEMRRDLALWVLLLLLLAILRGPGFVWEVINIDETDFYLYGRAIVDGGSTYETFVEKKPPLIYWFYALLIAAGLEDLRSIRFFTLFWVFAGSFVLFRAALAWGLTRRAAWLGALVFGAFSSNISIATDCETVMNLPVVATALLLAPRFTSRGQRAIGDVLAGISLGLASLFKHQAAAALVAVAGFLISSKDTRRLLVVLLGFALPLTATLLWFAVTSRFEEFLEWNIARNIEYTSKASLWDWSRFVTALGLYGVANGLPFIVLGIYGVRAVCVNAERQERARADFTRLAVWLFWTSWLGVLPGGRFYTHYFLQVVPGAAMLCAAFAEKLLALGNLKRTAFVSALVAAVVGFGANNWVRGIFKRNFPSQDVVAKNLAEWLRANTDANDKIFVWGYFNPIYYLAQRTPASRFINPSPIIGDFDPLHVTDDVDVQRFVNARDALLVIDDLERAKCRWFVDTAPSDLHGWRRFPLAVVYSLSKYVQEKFEVKAIVSDAVVYRRVDTGG